MNRLLVITRGSSVHSLRASVKWLSHRLYLSPAQGTQGNRTVCGITQGVSSHSWKISTPVVRIPHTAWSFVAYPHPCLNSHAASKGGQVGCGQWSHLWAGLPGRVVSYSGLHTQHKLSVFSLPCPLCGSRDPGDPVGCCSVSPSASAPLEAVSASFVQQMGAAFQFPQQSPKVCSWPEPLPWPCIIAILFEALFFK